MYASYTQASYSVYDEASPSTRSHHNLSGSYLIWDPKGSRDGNSIPMRYGEGQLKQKRGQVGLSGCADILGDLYTSSSVVLW